jgi:zinc transport system ATP-binding protein
MEPVIEIKDVSVSFDGNPALDGITMSVAEKEFLGVIGPNGGGKTTLLKVILGLVKPDAGEVRVFGKTPVETRRFIGYVPQRTEADSNFPITVREAVLMGRLSHRGLLRRYAKADFEAAEEAIRKVEMAPLAGRQFGKLSSGERQRALIARALASEPRILLLDEPTASLDTKIGHGLYELLDELNREITIVLVTHDIGAVSRHVRTVACLAGTLQLHAEAGNLDPEIIQKAYGCPVDLIAHGAPHRVFGVHDGHVHEGAE